MMMLVLVLVLVLMVVPENAVLDGRQWWMVSLVEPALAWWGLLVPCTAGGAGAAGAALAPVGRNRAWMMSIVER